MKIKLLLLCLFYLFTVEKTSAQTVACTTTVNLLINPAFSSGTVGFSSLLPTNAGCISDSYTVTSNFNLKCPGWGNVPDHTGGSPRYFLIVDGSTSTNNLSVWQQSVSVCSGKTYTFSFWARNANKHYEPESCSLTMVINGTEVYDTGEIPYGTWTYYSYVWSSGATSGVINLNILQDNYGALCDFGIDDVFFGKCCSKLSAPNSYTVENGSTFAIKDGNFSDFTWTDGYTTSSGVYFAVNPVVNTTYTITASDGCGCVSTVTTQVIVLPCKNPVNIVTNANFSAGNTGFSSLLPATNDCSGGTYTVTTSFNLKCGSWAPFPDHTTPVVVPQNYLAIQAKTSGVNKTVWQQTVNVCSGKKYVFSFWALGTSTSSPVSLSMKIGSGAAVSIGPLIPGGWNYYQYPTAYTGSGPTVISIIQNAPVSEEHYGIDDVYFGYCCAPIFVNGDLSFLEGSIITLTASGASTYTWASSTKTIGGATFTDNPTGTTVYTVMGSDGCACMSTATVLVRPCQNIANLLINPTFSLGNVGINSILPANPGCLAGTYTVNTNFNLKCPGWPSTSDHTGGSPPTRKYLIVDAGTSGTNKTVWQQTITACQSKKYVFSFWAFGPSNPPSTPTSAPVSLNIKIGSGAAVNIGPIIPGSWNYYQYPGVWTGVGPTVVSIIQNTPLPGKYYGIDDVSFAFCCNPVTVTGNTTICSGGSATLTANGANTYTWTSSAGTSIGSTSVVTPTTTTQYTVTGSDGCGCVTPTVFTITVNPCKPLGTDQQPLLQDGLVKIFPNPNNGIFSVNLNTEQVHDIFVYNTLGQMVFSSPRNNKQDETIDISSLPNGLYIVSITIKGETHKYKIIKE